MSSDSSCTVSFSSANRLSSSSSRSDSKCFFIILYRWLFSCFMSRVAFGCFSCQSISMRRMNPFCLGLLLIVTDDELLVFFSCLVMTCGCVGPVAITVLHRDRRRQHGPFYPRRRLSQYRFLVGLTHSGCFGPHYFQALSIGLAGYFVAQAP